MVDLLVVRKGGITTQVDAAIAAQKNVANGIAPLDADSKVPAVNSRVESVAGRQGAITLGVADVSGAVALADKGVANGVAPLDASNLVPEIHIPAVAITDTFPVSSEAAMLALTAQRGDVAIRSDINKSFVLRLTPASTLANWAELRTPTDAVLSVDGRTGAVSLSDLYASINDARLKTIRDEGTTLADRAILDFIGTGVIVEDDSVTGRTKVTISGAAAGAASETAAGIAEIATQAETNAGTDGVRFVTPSKLDNSRSLLWSRAGISGDSTVTGATSNTWVKVALNTLLVNGGMTFDTVNNRFTITRNGVYRVRVSPYFNGGAVMVVGHSYRIAVGKNSSFYLEVCSSQSASSRPITPYGECLIPCVAGDTLIMMVTNTSTTAPQVGVGSFMEAEWAGY